MGREMRVRAHVYTHVVQWMAGRDMPNGLAQILSYGWPMVMQQAALLAPPKRLRVIPSCMTTLEPAWKRLLTLLNRFSMIP